MIKTTVLMLSAVALMAVAGCETMTTASSQGGVTMLAKKPKSCRTQVNEPIGSPPVVSYYCAAPDEADDPVQLDVYVGFIRHGPYFLPCDELLLPDPVYTMFCT